MKGLFRRSRRGAGATALGFCALLTAVGAGCGKEEPATPPAPPAATTPPATAGAAAGTGAARPTAVTALQAISPIADPAGYYDRLIDAKAKLLVTNGLAAVKETIMAYKVKLGRYPASLDEMRKLGPLPELPADAEFAYDAATGTISVVPRKK
ncbi:MAG: hypothetical protein HZA54_00815 [Planctomycetes bacterium]|nr:hypothetical protein [Planctomycetota bacterium]